MMLEIIARAQPMKCSMIELWVDESRTVARNLYSSYKFEETQYMQDYYAPGPHGIKMRLCISQELELTGTIAPSL
jgi:ribosomal protein S18 acetylase RimI-like enzyme